MIHCVLSYFNLFFIDNIAILMMLLRHNSISLKNKEVFMQKILFSFIIALSFSSCSSNKTKSKADETNKSKADETNKSKADETKPRTYDINHKDSKTQFEDTEFFKAWNAVIEVQSQLKTSYSELEKIVNATPQADLSNPTKPKPELDKASQAYWGNHAKTRKAYESFFKVFKDEKLQALYNSSVKNGPDLPKEKPADWPQQGIGMAFPQTYYLHSELEKFNQAWSESFGDKTKAQEKWSKAYSQS